MNSRMHGIPQNAFHSHQHAQEELQKVAVGNDEGGGDFRKNCNVSV